VHDTLKAATRIIGKITTTSVLNSMDELYTMPGHLSRRVQQIATTLFAEECGSFDLTPVQFAALIAIRAHPGVDATRLSALIAYDRSTICDVLRRLRVKGWVHRTYSETDNRVKLLSVTPEGEKVLRRALPAVRRVQERLLEPLARKDRSVLLRLLSQLSDQHRDILPTSMRASK
jgi:MarR family transcriptional regulator, lower aerobic nicotinate degradation pathway regulator